MSRFLLPVPGAGAKLEKVHQELYERDLEQKNKGANHEGLLMTYKTRTYDADFSRRC